jgi:uncharacterized membrane protein YagU involved in acid resistance
LHRIIAPAVSGEKPDAIGPGVRPSSKASGSDDRCEKQEVVTVTTSRFGGTEEPLVRRLLRGAVGGVLAGAVFAGVTMWFAHSTGGKADMPLAMMATIVQGDAAMAAGTANPTVGVLVHLALSALFGAVFALAVPRLRTNGTVAVAGTAYGLLLYVVNFLVLTPLLFTTFKAANQPFEVFAHMVFGTLLSFAFFGSGARRGERALAIERPSTSLSS